MARQPKFLPPKPGKDKLLIKGTQGKKPETLDEAIKDMKSGGRSGFLGEGNIIRKPDYRPEVDSSTNLPMKRAIQMLLINTIQPNPLSIKSSPEMDKRSLVNKINRRSLSELKQLLPNGMKYIPLEELNTILEKGMSDEDKAEIQNLYMEVSP